MSNKVEKRGLVPKLRFPEFREAGEWEEKRLQDITSSVFDGTHQTPIYTLEGIPFYSVENLISGNKNKFISREDYLAATSKNKPNQGDILLTRIGKIGYSQVVTWSHEFSVYVTLAVIKKSALFDSHYLHCFMQSDRYQNEILKKSLLNAVPCKINMDSLRKTNVLLPKPAEQQKIADCLASLDELITLEAQKLDTLKTHKKGLMHQLFPAEGETLPKLRFPEFRDTGEWEEVALGEIAEIKLGKMLDSKKHTTGNLLPYLNNLAVRWNDVETSNLPKMYFDESELDRFGLRTGDVVVCEGGEPGRSAVWDGRFPDLKFQKAIHRVRFTVPFQPRLLVLYLESIAGTPRLENLFTGGGIKHLTQEVFARLKIPFASHAEQKKIADCLTSLDDLITAQTQKLAALKTHKKGLMQQLFPVLDEVAA
ncbi:MAG: restriction endonuclease subunit S [Chromatiaceae bacterium]|nr:restriction endonuclease subunit S [Chromatiaceae bacterium]